MDHLVSRAFLVVQGLLHTVIEDMHVEGNAQDVLVTLGIAASPFLRVTWSLCTLR